ncbi:MAG TPA: MFS transporter [Myxococcales bacterium]|jgi:ACS family hexuronate transporter-like MFS transporter|nr:MFS transporter [Myxococcales bacterium]
MSEAAAIEAGPVRRPMPQPVKRFTVPGLRWWIAGLLTCVTIINYLDRTALAVVGPTLKKELSIDEETFSYVVIAFQTVYGLMMPVAGRIIDWLNIRVGYAVAIVWWSIAQALTGFAGGWRSLAVLRGALGVGEAGNFPGAIKTVSQWFPPKERTVATGIVNMGSGVGALLAPPLVVFVILRWGWRASFVLTGVLGLIWVVFWLIFYRAPEKHPWLSAQELKHIRKPGEPCPTVDRGSKVIPLVIRERNFWALSAARFLSEPAWQLFTYWIPFYLVSARHLDLKQVAYFGWMPFLAGDLGCLAGGLLSPFFQRLGLKVLTARKAAMTVPAVLMTLTAFIGLAPSAALAVALFSVGAFAHQAISSTLLTLPADLFPTRAVATANGLSGTAGYLGGILFTFIVGRAAVTVGYTPLFFCIAVFDIIGAVCLWVFLKSGTKESSPEVAT